MSLPPGFLDELRGRVTLGRVVGRKVAWDAKKSNQAKGDLWAPCPFHQEKSASFHVDDRKGFYYCFGCHAKGDAIAFVRETENVSFIEAVEILAREAGMPMPAQDPRAAEQASRAKGLAEVMELAVQHYRLALQAKAGEEARAYLARRGLGPDALARWEIGLAVDDRQGLSKALVAKGVTPDQLLEAGLTGEGQGGAYDRFAGRIIFPIRDARGRAIALGGRSLDPNARAKYLNSPQTPLFDKGRTLFNHASAREAVGKGAALIVAEGYMDVIALSEAGFGGAVAPLGTAVTDDQLTLLWRIGDEPVVALDGDAAGMRAALRVIDLALPRLEAGKGLRFAMLSEGQDPDDLIRAKGAPAMQAVLDAAQPMVRLLWERETSGRVFDSPERKATLDKTLQVAVAAIKDPSIRRHYEQEIKGLKWELWGFKPRQTEKRSWQEGRRPKGAPLPSTPSARASALAVGAAPEDQLRDAILAILILTPDLISTFSDEVEAMVCADPDQALIRDALMRHVGTPDLREALMHDVGAERVETLLSARHIRVLPPVANPGDADVARLSVAGALADLSARQGHRAALSEGIEDIAGLADEWLTRRLGLAAAGVDVTRPKETEDVRETVTASNGIAIDRELKTEWEQVHTAIDFTRGGRGGKR